MRKILGATFLVISIYQTIHFSLHSFMHFVVFIKYHCQKVLVSKLSEEVAMEIQIYIQPFFFPYKIVSVYTHVTLTLFWILLTYFKYMYLLTKSTLSRLSFLKVFLEHFRSKQSYEHVVISLVKLNPVEIVLYFANGMKIILSDDQNI